MKQILLCVLMASVASGAFAKSHSYKKSYSHSSHKTSHKKETCWRTNRSTGAKFKIC